MEYGISSRDYLLRARERLGEGTKQALFYAAFELRCGIESRMHQYLEVWDHISKKKKEGWKIADLGRGVQQAFRSGNEIARLEVHDEKSQILMAILYYTPVSPCLQKHGERLGSYLHSMKEFRKPDDLWWNYSREDLEIIAAQLEGANRGTLLGPPLVRKQGGSAHIAMNIELLPGSDATTVLRTLKASTRLLTFRVKYLERLPVPLEPEAYVWNPSS